MIEPTTMEEAGAAVARSVLTRVGRAGWERAATAPSAVGSDGLVLPCGAGTKSGDRPIADDAVTTRRLTRVIEYAPADMTITVEAGVTVDGINALAAADNLRLPLDPPGYGGRATIGGVLATNDAGPLRFACGSPRDNVLGMSIILGDGTLIRSGGRVVKNVAGYGLHRLMCGSWGSLGLIAAATLKLRPRPEALRLAEFRPRDEAAAEDITAELLAGSTRPAFVEWLLERGAGGVRVIVGFEDCAEAVAWQLEQLFGAGVLHDAEASGRRYGEIREWGAVADVRAALPSGNVHHVFRAAARLGVPALAHAATGTVLARCGDSAVIERLAAAVREYGGGVIVPRRLAADDHAELRAGLRAAMRMEPAA